MLKILQAMKIEANTSPQGDSLEPAPAPPTRKEVKCSLPNRGAALRQHEESIEDWEAERHAKHFHRR